MTSQTMDGVIPRPILKAKPRRRRLVWLLAALAAAGGGYGLYRTLGSASTPPPSYATAKLQRGDIEQQVTATGTLSPLVTVTVGSQVTGRIQEILADYNSRVHKGQVIARIDSQIFHTEVDRARANLTAAQANLRKADAAAREARLQYERDRGLAEKKVVAQAEVDTREASYQSALAQVAAGRAAVTQAQAALSQARTNLAYTTIVSPIDGVVVSRSVDVGQTVAASLSAPTLFTIAEDLRRMEVHTSVAESDVGKLAEGMPVRFSVDAFADEEFAGEVKQVRYEAQTVQNVVTYDAVVSVDNAALKLRPGMTANVSFIVAAREGALRLPAAALRFRPQQKRSGVQATAASQKSKGKGKGEGRAVWVLQKGQPAPVRIKTGISDGSFTEVLEGGLREGDQVIVGLASETTSASAPAAKKAGSSGGGRRGPPRIL